KGEAASSPIDQLISPADILASDAGSLFPNLRKNQLPRGQNGLGCETVIFNCNRYQDGVRNRTAHENRNFAPPGDLE
ncbi:MAG TPA: hypothetical protein VK855_02725, partial [Thioalkalivibrio sp.]|nr:hypothetical protein [Thioalkalivibrio sp.]